MDRHALTAAARFGLGPGPNTLARITSDPRGWLHGQVDALQQRGRAPGPEGMQAGDELTWAFYNLTKGERAEVIAASREVLEQEQIARAVFAVETAQPFVERLVWFFSNHLTVSVTQVRAMGLLGAFEREVVRENLARSFGEMLQASCRHPAMLLYLDQVRSVGPDSAAAQRNPKLGLNENLAREILELHTLGVDGGYAQQDVEALAAILTGWTLEPEARGPAFRFNERMHQPGTKWLLSWRYPERGETEGTHALQDLATHPATARHLATKLARHFISDTPPPQAVAALEEVYLRSGGSIPALARALIDLEACWAVPLGKLKTPLDLVISTARALGYRGEGKVLVASQRALGQMPWTAPSPAGWPDEAAFWSGPDAVLSRVDWVRRAAQRADVDDPEALAPELLGPWFDRDLERRLKGHGKRDKLGLILASPAWQRR